MQQESWLCEFYLELLVLCYSIIVINKWETIYPINKRNVETTMFRTGTAYSTVWRDKSIKRCLPRSSNGSRGNYTDCIDSMAGHHWNGQMLAGNVQKSLVNKINIHIPSLWKSKTNFQIKQSQIFYTFILSQTSHMKWKRLRRRRIFIVCNISFNVYKKNTKRLFDF